MTTTNPLSTLGEIIWTVSRADEGTISATGANVIARAILDSDFFAAHTADAEARREAELCEDGLLCDCDDYDTVHISHARLRAYAERQVAAAEARGAERGARAVVEAVEAYYHNDAGSHAGYGRAARAAAARIEGGA